MALGIRDHEVIINQDKTGLNGPRLDDALLELNSGLTILENKYETKEIFDAISGTTGTVTTYTNITISQDKWAGENNALAVEISAGRPTQNFLFTATGDLVEAIIDSDGNYTLSGTPTVSDYAICWIVTGKAVDFATASIPEAKIIQEYDLESPLVKNGTTIQPIVDGDNLDMGTGDAKASTISLNTAYTPTGSEVVGQSYWDSENKTISDVLENGVIGQRYKEVFIDGQNDTGSTIANGKPVSYAGSIGNSGNFRIKLSKSSSTEPPYYFIGIATENIIDGDIGKITIIGKVRGIQTNGANYGETWNQGDIIYVSGATAGYLTKVAPEAPIPAIPVALVISAHDTNGTLEVRPTFPTSIKMLSDVDGTAHDTDGQILVYDSVNEYWDADHNINDYVSKAELIANGGCDLMGIDYIGTPTYTNQCQFNSSFGSAGRKSGGTITDEGSSYISVSAGTGFIKALDDDNAVLYSFNWSALSNTLIPADSVRYIGVEYNGGSPQVSVRSSFNWDLDTDFPLGIVVNETTNSTEELYIYNSPWWVTDGMTNVIEVIRSFGLIRRDETIGGLTLSVTGTRNVSVTSGQVWSGLNEFAFAGLDTNVTGTFEYYWYSSTNGWQRTDNTQYSVTQWNDITQPTLQTIDNNKYLNIWVYGELNDTVLYIALIYPQAQYNTAAEAQEELPPEILPTHVKNYSLLLGRVIIKQSVDTPISVESAFTQSFQPGVVGTHNNLSGLQGGSVDEYYHHTADEYSTYHPYYNTIGTWTASQDFSSLDIGSSGTPITSLSQGTTDNDKLPTQGYVDDAIAFENLLNDNTTDLVPVNARGFDILTGEAYKINSIDIKDVLETLTNKTIDVDNNTVSNIEIDNFKTGIVETTITNNDTKLPTSGAVVDYAEPAFSKNTAFNLNLETNTANIKMNGAVSVGVLSTLARADHIHASDTSKVSTTGNETIAGIKTFSSFPITPSSAPTTNYQVANKKYVDDTAGNPFDQSLNTTDDVVFNKATLAEPLIAPHQWEYVEHQGSTTSGASSFTFSGLSGADNIAYKLVAHGFMLSNNDNQRMMLRPNNDSTAGNYRSYITFGGRAGLTESYTDGYYLARPLNNGSATISFKVVIMSRKTTYQRLLYGVGSTVRAAALDDVYNWQYGGNWEDLTNEISSLKVEILNPSGNFGTFFGIITLYKQYIA